MRVLLKSIDDILEEGQYHRVERDEDGDYYFTWERNDVDLGFISAYIFGHCFDNFDGETWVEVVQNSCQKDRQVVEAVFPEVDYTFWDVHETWVKDWEE